MNTERRMLSDRFWLSLASTFGSRKALHEKAAGSTCRFQIKPLCAFFPEDPSEVSIILGAARAENVPVVVCGTSERFTAGLEQRLPREGYVALVTKNLAGIEEIQSDSLWMSVRAGTELREVRTAAEKRGLRPVGFRSPERGTIGGWLSCVSRCLDPILGVGLPPVLGLQAVLPAGNLVQSVSAPRSANGPDLFSLFLGTRGGFGVITRVTLKLEPLPERKVTVRWSLPNLGAAVALLRTAVTRIFPPRDAHLLSDASGERPEHQVVLRFEGDRRIVEAALRFVHREAKAAAGRRTESGGQSHQTTAACWERSIRWSELTGLLRDAEGHGGITWLSLEAPDPVGCRMRLALRVPGGKPDAREPSDSTVSEAMERIRSLLDPGGIVNPQAWPLLNTWGDNR